jgi:flagellin
VTRYESPWSGHRIDVSRGGDVGITSIATNVGALLAQRYLRAITSELTLTQNRLSSGLRVNTVTDDASTYAVAAGLRGDIKAYTAVSGALQGSVAAANVAVTAGESIGERIGDIKAKLLELSNDGLPPSARDAYNADLAVMVAEVNAYLQQASYNGNNLLGTGGSDLKIVANIDGSTIDIRNQDVANLVVGTINNNGQAKAAIDDLAVFEGLLNTALSNLGSDLNRVARQREFIARTEETVRIGLGALVDADIERETSYFNALQAQQQLAIQTLGIINQNPSVLLGLFRTD